MLMQRLACLTLHGGVYQTCDWRIDHGLSLQYPCCASYCWEVLGVIAPSLAPPPQNSQPPYKDLRNKKSTPDSTTFMRAFSFNDVSYILMHYDGLENFETHKCH